MFNNKLKQEIRQLREDLMSIEQVKSSLDSEMLVLQLDPQGRIEMVNGNFESEMLYRADQLLGRKLEDIVPAHVKTLDFYQRMKQAINRGEHLNGAFRLLRGNGEEAWLRSILQPVKGSDGRLRYFTLHSSDLTRTIATLKQSHPRLSMSIQVDTSDVLVQALLQDQLDIVLGRIPAGARAEELLFDSLGEEALCVIASAQNPLAKEKHLSWAELQNMTWVLQQQPSPMRAIINQVFHNARVDIPSSIVETTSIMTLLSLVQQTDMIGVTPVSVVEDYPGRHLLAVLPIQFEARLPPFGLITRRHRIQSSAMQAFMNSVRKEHGLNRD